MPFKATTLAGASIQGQLTGWNDDGFAAAVDGANRRIAWDDLTALDVFRLRKRLLDEMDPAERKAAALALVSYFVSRDDGDGFADAAFREAKRWKATEEERRAAVAASEARRQARNEAAARIERTRLATGSPEAYPFSSVPWPAQSVDERAKAVADLKRAVTAILAASGRELTPIDGTQVLVSSGVSLEDAGRRAADIEAFIEASLPKLGLPKETNPWLGKLAVIVSEDRARFEVIEASGFRQQPGAEATAVAHYDGGSAFVHLLKATDEGATAIATDRAVALALLHRRISAARLPAWANEGFADWLVATYAPTKSLDRTLRSAGLPQVRSATGFGAALRAVYRPKEWPFADEATRGAAFILVSYLVERNPKAFLSFLEIVKGGEPWEQAFQRAFAMPVARAAAMAADFHRVND